MEGGDGDDVYYIDDLGDLVIEHEDGGYDKVYISISSYQGDLSHIEEVILVDPATNFPANPETGGQLIIGNTAASNTIYGGAGGDEIWGQGLADLQIGSASCREGVCQSG